MVARIAVPCSLFLILCTVTLYRWSGTPSAGFSSGPQYLLFVLSSRHWWRTYLVSTYPWLSTVSLTEGLHAVQDKGQRHQLVLNPIRCNGPWYRLESLLHLLRRFSWHEVWNNTTCSCSLVDLEPLSSECNRISFLCCYSHAYGDSRGGGARRALKAYSWLWDCSLSTKLTQTQTVKGTRVTARKYYYTNTWGLLFMHQYFSDVSLHSYVPYLRSHSISTTP